LQRFNAWLFVCGVLQAAQQWEVDVVVVGVVEVVVAVLASISSSVLRFLIARLCPSFAAFVHHSRADSFD
jgi:phage shock protein PspC (stress-responsive transcriptional regulator)